MTNYVLLFPGVTFRGQQNMLINSALFITHLLNQTCCCLCNALHVAVGDFY